MAVLASYIVPHPPLIVGAVGRGEEKKIQKTVDSYHAVSREIASLQPETIVVISPHAVAYEDYFHIASGKGANGDFSAFGAGDVSLYAEFDEEFIDALSNIAQKKSFMRAQWAQGKKIGSWSDGPVVFYSSIPAILSNRGAVYIRLFL